jgi:uncharacterized protein YgbK (DUF1537 family)
MTSVSAPRALGLAVTLRDAVALADSWGPGTSLALGTDAAPADILAPAALTLHEKEALGALRRPAGAYFISFGNQAAPPVAESLGRLLELAITETGIGFMAASLAAPGMGRTVFQGHLFQGGRLIGNLQRDFSNHLSGRVVVIAHHVVASGPAAIRRAVAAAREQGAALALLDAVDARECAAIATALRGQLLLGGPAWLAGESAEPEPESPTGKLAILSGALDRQTLYQLGAARAAMPFLQLYSFSPADTGSALAWAAAQTQHFVISASAPPDRLDPRANAGATLADIAAGLEAAGTRRFVIAGNDTAAAILARLGVRNLTAGAAESGLRWVGANHTHFLLKPGGWGEKNLFLGEFGPQIRLNATAECAS